MQAEIIFLKNLKNNKTIDCNYVLIPSSKGEIFVDEKSNKIILEVIPGTLKFNNNNEIKEINVDNTGVAYFDQLKLTIILR